MIGLRQRSILKAVINDYITQAVPVSSEGLRERHRFGVCAATIRNNLAWLEEAGFLDHVHTSSGRVPTSQGYRFFVDELLEPVLGAADKKAFARLMAEPVTSPLELCQTLGRRTQTFIELWDGWGGLTYTSRVTDVLDQPEFRERATILDFLEVSEWLKSEAARFLPRLIGWSAQAVPKVYIGNELTTTIPAEGRPDGRLDGFSFVVVSLADRRGRPFVMVAAGVKRMAYPKVIGLFEWLKVKDLGAILATLLSLIFIGDLW